jgi:quercetin dioxygenase-like cupin family protein
MTERGAVARNEDPETGRLRTAPAERFAGSQHVFSLDQLLADLRSEAHPARGGHRQITLLQRGPVTQVLFSFEPGGRLREHSAAGLVTIHVLEGQLDVSAEGVASRLAAGDVLILDPSVAHDVEAAADSAMLLTVHLDKDAS